MKSLSRCFKPISAHPLQFVSFSFMRLYIYLRDTYKCMQISMHAKLILWSLQAAAAAQVRDASKQ
jgi:hypothetical protein